MRVAKKKQEGSEAGSYVRLIDLFITTSSSSAAASAFALASSPSSVAARAFRALAALPADPAALFAASFPCRGHVA